MMFPTIAILDRHGIIRVQMTGEDKLMSKDIQERSLREAIERVAVEGTSRGAKRTTAVSR
jgi:hypothetical protein